MDWLNYHHLLYFYTVAREGSMTRASELLRLAPSTVSVQIKTLEDSLGTDLFERRGRRLILTEAGRIAFEYAEDIFDLGQELTNIFHGRSPKATTRLRVGIADVLWKDIATQLLAPAFEDNANITLTCIEGSFDSLLAQMGIHDIDVLLSDTPLAPSAGIKAFNHLLGKSSIAFFGAPDLVPSGTFPENLNGVPLLLPTKRTALRRRIDQWFQDKNLKPYVIGEFDDSALMKSFGIAGEGVFPAPKVVEFDLIKRGLINYGTVEKVEQKYFAISPERRIKIPAVQAICDTAREDVFN